MLKNQRVLVTGATGCVGANVVETLLARGHAVRAMQRSTSSLQALEGLAERKSALARTAGQRQEEERRVNTIHREQSRIRENMARLDRDTDLYKRYVGLLNEQEDLLEQALTAIEELRAQEQRQREELDRYIMSLDLP